MRPPRVLRAGFVVALLAASACTDRPNPLGPDDPGGPRPPGGPGAPPVNLAALDCRGNVQTLSVECGPATSLAGDALGLIVGYQNVYVRLTASGFSYNGGTGQFTFQTTLENLIEQPMGTVDGTTPDPGGIRIFFYSGPVVSTGGGTGVVGVVPDGFDTFTSAAQAYYAYPYVLDQNETSPGETWTFIVPPTVTSFEFTVLVAAPVEYPTGYITLDGQLPGAAYGPMHPSAPHTLTPVVKNALGVVIPGTVSFGTTDPDCATVSGAGLVTGIRAGTCSITATSGALAGEMVFDVTGTTRTWNGSASADWSAGANWNGGYSPAAADSAVIPAGTPNDPALTAATAIGGVNVADAATLTLGAHTLTVGADLATGATGGIVAGGPGLVSLNGAGAAHGRVPSLWVTGNYALDGDLLVVAPQSIRTGRLFNPAYQLRIVAQ